MELYATKTALAAFALALLLTPAGRLQAAATAERLQITGEVMDTWCYTSEVMGGSDAVLGSAHHQCAVWCAAGGVPVGILSDDGEVYLVLKLGDDDRSNANPKILKIQSNRVTVDGEVYRRDGLNYLLVDQVVSDEGIVNLSHEDYGVIPAFGVPKQ
ncbi:MAG TPA: hypothetical protein VKN76_05220 [Kiloniellaceae bacterium]|nr:hypothetical protein [Kiloniellaceae bacterium]